MSKTDFATQAQQLAHNARLLSNHLKELTNIYFDRGYNSGGADAIGDDDLTDFEFNAATLGGMITLAQQFDNLLNNSAVAQGDYDATLSKMRKVADLTRRPY